MTQLELRPESSAALLENLAQEVRTYMSAAALNLMQAGRALIEARKHVPHGEWGAWLKENADISASTANNMMRSWERFGSNPAITGVQRSSIIKMLALPEGTEEEFLAEHDVRDMSARQVEDAVKEIRERLDREKEAAIEAERQKISGETAEALRQKDKEIGRLQLTANDALAQSSALRTQNKEMHAELAETEGLLAEKQAEYEILQEKYLAVMSDNAKGDAEREVHGQLGGEEFAAAVRTFMGAVSSMPLMGRHFAAMQNEEYSLFEDMLGTVEDWARRSREAMKRIGGVML